MVGDDPGGTTDAHARYMSRALPDFIPGNPNIRVVNLTPNIVERNFVWNAEPDGLTLALEATPGVIEQFMTQAQFDMREATMIGVTSGREEAWFIRGTLSYDCIEDAFDAPFPDLTIAVDARTPADLGSNVAVGWLADQLNIPLRLRRVPAAATSEQYAMIERGHVNSWVSRSVWNQLPITRPGWVTSGFVRPFADLSAPGVDIGNNGEGDFDCPNVHDTYLDDPDDQALWLAMRPDLAMSYNLIGPPGMSAGVTEALRNALASAMADTRFASNMENFTGIRNRFTDGATAQQDLTDTVNAYIRYKGQVDLIARDVFNKYVR